MLIDSHLPSGTFLSVGGRGKAREGEGVTSTQLCLQSTMEIARKHILDSAISMEVGPRRSYLTRYLNDGHTLPAGLRARWYNSRGHSACGGVVMGNGRVHSVENTKSHTICGEFRQNKLHFDGVLSGYC